MKALLIVDDQIMYGRALDRALRAEYSTIVALSLAEAQRKVQDALWAALIDICLSETDSLDRQGLEVIRWLRGEMPSLPIVAMSAIEEDGLEEKTLKAGATKFIRKPIVISRLRELLLELHK